MSRDRKGSSAVDLRRLPNELEQFLARDVYSMVIKGEAGTGKTALALTILSGSLQMQNCLYISSRLAVSELFEYYPWVQSFVPATKDGNGKSGEETTDIAPFVDARLDEPQSLFERITNQLMDASSPLIVIDTWDAVGDFMDKEALMTNAKILQIWRQRARAKLIFVLENVHEMIFDNLVDGVVDLEQEYVNSRRTRRIHLSKLRGVKIERPHSFFTLDHGVFHSFNQYNQLMWADSKLAPAPVPSQPENLTFANESESSPDSVEDILNGRIPKHSVVNIELDPTISSKSVLPFISRMIAGYSRKTNAKVAFLPPIGVASENIDLLLNAFIPNSRQRKRVEVLPQPNLSGETGNGDFSEKLKTIIARNRRNEKNLEFLGVLSVEPVFDRTASAGFEGLAESVISGFDSSIIVTRSRGEKSERFVEISDVRMKVVELDGNLFVQPENPWDSLYAIQNEADGRLISVRPMV